MPATKSQRKYRQKVEVKSNYAKYQKDNYKNIAASFTRAEAIYIADIFAANGLKPAEIIRGAAAALLDGQPIRTEAKPLNIPEQPTDSDNPTD